jgi:hypothetical protein
MSKRGRYLGGHTLININGPWDQRGYPTASYSIRDGKKQANVKKTKKRRIRDTLERVDAERALREEAKLEEARKWAASVRNIQRTLEKADLMPSQRLALMWRRDNEAAARSAARKKR